MANSSNKGARRTHVSPGVYTSETELNYAAKSLGITTLGVAGETLKGPAFQPISIENWREFQNYFGGTSVEKFRGSKYPKYELPYIAQSYLKQSNQLEVVRVLGLSGVNAGPAWVITASAPNDVYDKMVVAVLRSRGYHEKASLVKRADVSQGICNDQYEFDGIHYYASNVSLAQAKSGDFSGACSSTMGGAVELGWEVDSSNYGRFRVKYDVTDEKGNVTTGVVKAVSFNPTDSNYILNVFGTDPEDENANPLYVAELYDVALQQLVDEGRITAINSTVTTYQQRYIVPMHAEVNGILLQEEGTLTRRDVGKRFLYTQDSKNALGEMLEVHKDVDGEPTKEGCVGLIFTVTPYILSDGQRVYYYANLDNESLNDEYTGEEVPDEKVFYKCVRNNADDRFYVMQSGDVTYLSLDLNDYKEAYRYASTPWVVSEIKGDSEKVELKKLFRFHTISDGDSSNTEVKVSIMNIDSVNGIFDVVVRDFYDTDASPVYLERYKGVNLIPGDKNFIGLRIGTSDGEYETVSLYITVELAKDEAVRYSTPAGFLGYPVRNYEGTAATPIADNPTQPYFKFNVTVDDDIRVNKQFFGVSDITGIDADILSYKGKMAYDYDPTKEPDFLTPGFHLDSRVLPEERNTISQEVSVDGVTGYKWYSVAPENVTMFGIEPKIGNAETILGTIYEDKRYAKFTMVFYGGWDGWDYYRRSRSNTDDFRYTKYMGYIDKNSGEGTMISNIANPEAYGFDNDSKINNSDYYAYFSAYKQLSNPKTIDINVLATPGIDYVNQPSLVNEVITIVEEERADSIYVVTTPDKPYGADDYEGAMYTPSEAVMNLEDSEIDSNYTCSYYPWVKYFDEANSQFIFLPPTRDVVRNFAYTDNTKYPWFAAAGWNRGDLEDKGVKPKKSLKVTEQDVLYDGRLNFVNTFAKEGMKIWGDKNLQIHESVMNRISKRRLLLHIRKLCAVAAIGLIFDPNDNTTAQSFRSAVTPILNNVLNNRGITDWRLEIDDSQEARDRLELPAKIFIRPIQNLEYIDINFIITPSGVSFDDI